MNAIHSFKLDKKNIPNYVIPLALVQAEIFWFCSVLYCIFNNSRLYNKKKLNRTRTRSHSAPASTKLCSLSYVQQPLLTPSSSSTSVSIKLGTIDEESNDGEYSAKELYRCSLTEPFIRKRPSIADELNGTTCPPVWWQKTRVKLGYTPIHYNHSIKSKKNLLQDTTTTTTTTTIMSSASSINSSSSSLDSYDLQSLVSIKSIEQNIEHIELRSHSTLSSNCSDESNSSSNTQKKTRLVSKIRAVFHHKRNKN